MTSAKNALKPRRGGNGIREGAGARWNIRHSRIAASEANNLSERGRQGIKEHERNWEQHPFEHFLDNS